MTTPANPEQSGSPPPPLSLADYVAASAAWLQAAAKTQNGPPGGSMKPPPPAWVGSSPPPGWEEALPRLLRSAEYWQKVLGPNPPSPPAAAEPGRKTEDLPPTATDPSVGTNPDAARASSGGESAAPDQPKGILYPRRYRFQAAGPQLHLTPAAAWAAWAATTAAPAADPGPLLVTDDAGKTWRPAAAAQSQAARRDPATLFPRDE